MSSVQEQLVERLPISINGCEKFATGLTKRTTVDDVKFAMLSVSDASFKPESLEDYGIFEKWQGNERLLDGKLKIYKLIRLWQSLPGDQLSQVKFAIKKRRQIPQSVSKKLQYRDANVEQPKQQQQQKQEETKRYTFCTLSPANNKTWNYEKAKRKTSFIQKQLNRLDAYESSSSLASSRSASPSSSDVDEDLSSENKCKRYASIKRFNRSKKSTVKQTQQIKKSFIELVSKQNEIIDKQLNKMADIQDRENQHQQTKKATNLLDCLKSKYIRSRSLETNKDKARKSSCQPAVHRDASTSLNKSSNKNESEVFDCNNINEQDVSEAFEINSSNSEALFNDFETKEYTKLCKDYFKVEHCLSSKLKKIEQLKSELNEMQSAKPANKVTNSIIKTNKKILNSIDTNKVQSEKLNDLNTALTRIDDIITLKSKFIQSLEQELQRLESSADDDSKEIKIVKEYAQPKVSLPVQKPTLQKNKLAYTSTSSTSSTSSVFTSISSISTSQATNYSQPQMVMHKSNNFTYVADNESDTGISSANSDDFNTQLETLV
jgi:hypothetical protein